MKHEIGHVRCPDKMCVPDDVVAEVHKFIAVIRGKTECFVTLICPNHQIPYSITSGTTYWSPDMIDKMISMLEAGASYEDATETINLTFKTNFKCQTRYHNGQSKGKEGPVIKKIEHLREMKADPKDSPIDAYNKAINHSNIDHKNRTEFWNQYRK